MTTDRLNTVIINTLRSTVNEFVIGDICSIVEKTVRMAVKAERERCAKIAEDRQRFHDERCPDTCKCSDGHHIAIAIRKKANHD